MCGCDCVFVCIAFCLVCFVCVFESVCMFVVFDVSLCGLLPVSMLLDFGFFYVLSVCA